MNRLADLARKTSETEIQASLLIDGSGKHEIITPVGFFTHMLETMAFHGRFDLTLSARGEVKVDEHHLVEDTGLVLGKLFLQALGEAKGINRAGQTIIPMDEALAMVAVDLGAGHIFNTGQLLEKAGVEVSTLICSRIFSRLFPPGLWLMLLSPPHPPEAIITRLKLYLKPLAGHSRWPVPLPGTKRLYPVSKE